MLISCADDNHKNTFIFLTHNLAYISYFWDLFTVTLNVLRVDLETRRTKGLVSVSLPAFCIGMIEERHIPWTLWFTVTWDNGRRGSKTYSDLVPHKVTRWKSVNCCPVNGLERERLSFASYAKHANHWRSKALPTTENIVQRIFASWRAESKIDVHLRVIPGQVSG